MMTDLGRWIAKRLEETDRTVDDLASAVGIDPGTLNEIMNGSIQRPPDARLSAIARFFGVSIDTVRNLIPATRRETGAEIRQGDRSPLSLRDTLNDWETTIRTDRPTTTTPFRLVEGVGDGLRTVQLRPWGTVESLKGTFTIDRESSRSIIDAFEQREGELVIDYEHQTLGGEHASPDGIAPAAGWIVSVFAEPGRGVFGMVRWNPRAAKMIHAGEYRFISPVLIVRKSDGKAVGLHSAAVTNLPAIDGMEALSASRARRLHHRGSRRLVVLLRLRHQRPRRQDLHRQALGQQADSGQYHHRRIA